MYSEKLSKLADYLAHEVKDDKFWLGNWYYTYDEFRLCDTVACAFGHAVYCFGRESGLRIVVAHDEESADISYQGEIGIYAAMEFFNLTNDEAHYLFIPNDETGYPDTTSRLDVAKRIKDFALTGEIK